MSALDGIAYWIAGHLPRRVKRWVVAQTVANAMMENPHIEVPLLTPTELMEALK